MRKQLELDESWTAANDQAGDKAPELHQPKSRAAKKALGDAFRMKYTKAEQQRFEKLVNRIDWIIDIIHRDREVKAFIQRRVDRSEKLYTAFEHAAAKFHLSTDHIQTIWYGKQHKKQD